MSPSSIKLILPLLFISLSTASPLGSAPANPDLATATRVSVIQSAPTANAPNTATAIVQSAVNPQPSYVAPIAPQAPIPPANPATVAGPATVY